MTKQLLFAIALILCLPAVAGAADRPNIVVILTDDQAIDTIAAFGNQRISTPNIDRIARSIPLQIAP